MKKKEVLLLIVIFVIAVFIRVKDLSFIGLGFSSDDAIYMTMARRFSIGDYKTIIHPHWSPLYPFISAIVNIFVKNWAITSRFVSIISGSLLIFPVYFISKEIIGKNEAYFSALITALSLPLILSSTQGLGEALYLLLLWLGILFIILSNKKRKFITYFLGGFFWGLATLTKSEGIMTIPSYFSYVFFSTIINKFFNRTSTLNFKKIANNLIGVIFGFLIIYYPYKLISKIIYPNIGFLSKTTAHFNLSSPFNLNNDLSSTWAQDIWSLDTFNQNSEIFKGSEKLLEREWRIVLVENMFKRIENIFGYYYKTYFNPLVLIAALIGLFGLLFQREKKEYFVFIITFFIPLFFSIMFFLPSSQDRYGYFVIPLLFIFTANFFPLFRRKNFIRLTILYLIFVFVINYIFYKKMIYMSNVFANPSAEIKNPSEREITDKWIRDNYPNTIVMGRHEGSVFYSGNILIYAPVVENFDDLISYAKKWDVDLIIANEDEIYTKYEYLYLEPKDYPNLKMLHKIGRWVVYKII